MNYENDFDLHENETAGRTHFHMKGFAVRLVLKQRHKRTRKWPIIRQVLSAPNPQIFFGRDETVQHSHKEFDNFISIW